MELLDLLLAEHSLIHSMVVAKSAETQLAEIVWSRLDDEQRSACPPGHNSVAWIVWHLARVEDVYVNAMIRGVPEKFDREGWSAKLAVDARDIGTGTSSEEVHEFSERVNIAALKEYRDSVGLETRAWLQDADTAWLDTVVDFDARLKQTPPYYDPERAAWVAARREGRTGLSFWSWGVVGHALVHLGEMGHIAATLGAPGR